jgi:membrane fusion protein, multidrug efflux system
MSEPLFNKNLGRSITLGIAVIVFSVIISKMLGGSKEDSDPKISFRSKVVAATPAVLASIPLNITVSGRLQATNRLELYSEVTGVLLTKNFREGQQFASGQVIASLDDAETRSALTAQRSSFMTLVNQAMADISLDYPADIEAWKSFVQNLNPTQTLPALPKLDNAQLKQFISGRNILTTYYNIQSQEARLRKHRIVAPYSGVLSEASIDPGTLVRAGQKIGTFVQLGGYELEAPVSRNDLKHLKVGSSVKLKSTELNKEFNGTVSRINSIINPTTQMVSVFLKVNGAELREGLYLKAVINGGMETNAMMIDRNMLEDGKAIFTIKSDSTLVLTPIEVISFAEEKAIIKGIESGTLVPKKAISGAFEGMTVEPYTK